MTKQLLTSFVARVTRRCMAAHRVAVSLVLLRPAIAHNTGAVGRTALGFGASLHLVKPLGFDIDSTAVKRAGLDYWPRVDLTVHETLDEFVDGALPQFDKAVFFSKAGREGTVPLTQADLTVPVRCGGGSGATSRDVGGRAPSDGTRTAVPSLALVFGSETDGVSFVPRNVLDAHECVYLPMSDAIRSYNLANAVAIGCFEAYRQNGLGS